MGHASPCHRRDSRMTVCTDPIMLVHPGKQRTQITEHTNGIDDRRDLCVADSDTNDIDHSSSAEDKSLRCHDLAVKTGPRCSTDFNYASDASGRGNGTMRCVSRPPAILTGARPR